ncbi:MAG: sulfate adenylyltransferase [Gammaproteobacteria bacterium]
MIKPIGTDELNPLFVYDSAENEKLHHEAETLPSVIISSQAAGNAVMMGAGYFNPLKGYMNVADAMGAAEKMTLSDGSFFPVPVMCLLENVDAIKDAKRIALRDPNVEENPILAVMDIEAIEEVSDAGPIQVLNFSYFQSEFPDTFRTAVEIRNEIQERGWNKVVAFQTRNPMHLAHEELCHMAMDRLGCDGLVIHMLLGKLKKGDIPAPVRDAAIRKMVELYVPPNSAMVTGYGFDMLYAGPREAVLHAYFRQNMGATHFIVGRDHAGVGDYYGAFDAQDVFDEVPAGALEIEIFKADHTAWSKKLNKVVMMREAPDHTKEDFILLSGTKVREMLGNGIAPPKEFSRPEVAQILIDYYSSLN